MAALKIWDGTQWIYVNPATDYQTEWVSTTPTAPTTGITPFTRFRARRLPAFIGPSGQDSHLQPALFSNQINQMVAVNASTTPFLHAMTTPTHLNNATATPTAVSIATTNFFTSMTRYRCATTTTAGTGGGSRTPAQWHFSSTANKGGFFAVARFGFNLIAAGSRAFVGMSTTTAALSPTVDPSTLLNLIGFGFDAADTTIQGFRNDGAGTATKGTTGLAKGTGGTASDFYEMRLFAPSGAGQSVYYSIQRLSDGTIFNASSPATTDLPAVDTLMAFHFHLSNGAVAAAHSIDIQSLYIETDN